MMTVSRCTVSATSLYDTLVITLIMDGIMSQFPLKNQSINLAGWLAIRPSKSLQITNTK